MFYYFHLLEYNKLLVGLGYVDTNWTIATSFEVIDLKSEYSVCPLLPDFPARMASPIGGLNYDREPVICGGLDAYHRSNFYCRRITNGVWKSSPLFLSRKRIFGSSYFSPDNFGIGRIFYAGGLNDQVIFCAFHGKPDNVLILCIHSTRYNFKLTLIYYSITYGNLK